MSDGPAAYLIDRAGIVRERISATDAHELYADAKARPGSNLTGDLETGFTYWAAAFDDVKLVRCHVHPLATPDAAPGGGVALEWVGAGGAS